MKHVLVTLIQNTALLAMMVVFDLIISRKPVQDQWRRQTLTGMIPGGGLMLASFKLDTVIIFDTRSVLLSVFALFLGTIPTRFTMVKAALLTRCHYPLPLSTSCQEWGVCQ